MDPSIEVASDNWAFFKRGNGELAHKYSEGRPTWGAFIVFDLANAYILL